jgi:cyclopropane fatty-acyl-phospholipid synthase-like methyltransferase
MVTKAKTELRPAKWQITATTIHCDLVDDFVTIMVNKEWSTKCAWYNRHKKKVIEDKKQKFDREMRLKIEKCQGPECSHVTGYRDTLIEEEFGER